MPEPRFDDDDLAWRLSSLVRASELTDGPGLADVHRRRDRHRRRIAAASGAAAVVAVAAVVLLVAVPLGITRDGGAAGPAAPTLSVEERLRDGAEQSRNETEALAEARRAEQERAAALALGDDAVVTAEELEAAGLAVEPRSDALDAGVPGLPALCRAPTWQEGWSDPGDLVQATFPLDGGTVAVDVLSYDDGVAANAALVTLKDDARACPTVDFATSVAVTAVGSAIGDEFVIFRLDDVSSAAGGSGPTWVTVARAGSLLVAAAVQTDLAAEDQQMSRDAAQAAVDHLATG